MSSWLIRATKQHISRMSPRSMENRFGGSFVDAEGNAQGNAIAIYQPDLSAVTGFVEKYWLVTGDVISLADQATRDAIDLAEDNARKDALADEVVSNDLLRAVSKTNLDLFNQERAARGASQITPAQYKSNVRGNL